MDYQYDVFLSYRRFGEWPNWVAEQFLPLFKHYLGERLGTEPRIAWDMELGAGASLPHAIAAKLAASKVLVALFSRQYFASPWCTAELGHMLARETMCQYRTLQRPAGLIVPAHVHDGEDVPELVSKILTLDLAPFVNVRAARGSALLEGLAQMIDNWAGHIEQAINDAPPCDPNWPTLAYEDIQQKLTRNPKQADLPRLTGIKYV